MIKGSFSRLDTTTFLIKLQSIDYLAAVQYQIIIYAITNVCLSVSFKSMRFIVQLIDIESHYDT